ncbi:MAG: serine/threonine protein kinase [Myxococcales bacterium FL481]|nr:MAG: serine/threonine protein kinase [Myxococcales bacterium FL481]
MAQRRIGSYRLVRPFPVASPSSRLFMARHEDDDERLPPRFVAKIGDLGGEDDAARVRRACLQHEARLSRAFNHAGIVAAHHDEVVDGAQVLILDYVEGIDLAALLGHGGDAGQAVALPKELAVYIMGQLADALHYVHGAEVTNDDGDVVPLGALHRDLCPANVLLSVEGDVLLADFGSATSIWLDDHAVTKRAGHVAYMAPERVTGTGEASQKSDLFALAVILWEMLRGQRCFEAQDELKTMDAISRFDISHASRRVTGISSKLSEILRKNLDRDPERRYTGAYQMLQRLAQAPEAAKAEQSRTALGEMVDARLDHGFDAAGER